MYTIQYVFIFIFFTFLKPILGKYVVELTNSNFKNVVSNKKMILVNFYAHWCPHCKRLKPTYEKAAKKLYELYPSIPIAQIDCAGAGRQTCWQYPVRGYPTVRLFRDGQWADRYTGRRTVASIVEFIQNKAPKPTKRPKHVPASWSAWGSWSGCSVTCGVGTRGRNRVCKGSNLPRGSTCSGDNLETKPCILKPCVEWSVWSSWSGCSVTCGMGSRTRNRACGVTRDTSSCPGNDTETKSCTLKTCRDACQRCRCQGKRMDCRWLSLTSIPRNIPSYIEKLDLSRNQIVNIPEDVFVHNTKIKTLNLGNNAIRELPKDVFKPLASMEILYLYNNQISVIRPGTFDGLFYLESLQLSNNKLQTLPPKVFDEVLGLEYMSLQGNAITSLPDNLFERLLLLKRLQLYSNKITTLQSGVFNGLMSLQYLALHKNKLHNLQAGAFDDLSSLQRLNLYDNEIVRLEDNLLKGLVELKSLDISKNHISSLPRGFLSSLIVTKIRTMKLSNNPLKCSCQLYREIEPLKNKVWGTCDNNVRISLMSRQQYCGISSV